jgi:hypothetical protein
MDGKKREKSILSPVKLKYKNKMLHQKKTPKQVVNHWKGFHQKLNCYVIKQKVHLHGLSLSTKNANILLLLSKMYLLGYLGGNNI